MNELDKLIQQLEDQIGTDNGGNEYLKEDHSPLTAQKLVIAALKKLQRNDNELLGRIEQSKYYPPSQGA